MSERERALNRSWKSLHENYRHLLLPASANRCRFCVIYANKKDSFKKRVSGKPFTTYLLSQLGR